MYYEIIFFGTDNKRIAKLYYPSKNAPISSAKKYATRMEDKFKKKVVSIFVTGRGMHVYKVNGDWIEYDV